MHVVISVEKTDMTLGVKYTSLIILTRESKG